jgi:hypothetical protein
VRVPSGSAGTDPAVAALSLALLVALTAFTLRRLQRSLRVFMPGPPEPRPKERGYGILVAVATTPTMADAEMLREVLAGHGIRSTVAAGDPDATGRATAQVLVFPDDAARARDLVATR